MSISKDALRKEVIGEKPHLATYQEVITEFSPEISFCNDNNIGSYRLSKKLLQRIMRPYHNNKKETLPGITKTELSILLLLLQIADNTCFVDSLYYKELLNITKKDGTPLFSAKSYYNALRGLKKKGFISFDEDWGTRNIQVLHNEIGPHDQFLSLNRESLTPGTDEHDAFCALPVGAQKIYLWIIANYHPRFGYTANIKELKELLKLKSKYLISAYIKKIETLLGPIKRHKSKRTRGQNDNIHLNFFNKLKIAKKDGLLSQQLSYFGRSFNRLLDKYDIDKNISYPLPFKYYRSEFFRMIKEYMEMGPKNVFKVIEYAISQQGVLNPQTITDAEYILVNAN